MPAAKDARKPKTAAPRYQPHPLLDMERRSREELEAQTGRTWEAWVRLARAHGEKRQKPLKAWLVKQHGLAPMQAAWMAWEATNDDVPEYGAPEALVDALYAGEKAALRPLHEALVDACLALGDDVVVTACKTMVPVYRRHVFAEMRPAPGAVELRLALGDLPKKGRLGDGSTMPGDRLTHAVRVAAKSEIDTEVKGWLARAYELGAGAIARKATAPVPPELAKALKASKPAATTWDGMTPAMRRDMIEWITSAKQAETKAKRLGTVVQKLAAGKRRVY
jgi:hypothetical protein